MKTKFTLKEIEVAIKDPNYLKYQNASKKEIAVAEEIIKGKYEKFLKADDCDNFKFPYYEGILKGKDMSMIFNNSKILWFPQYFLLNACLEKSVSQDKIDKWQESDFDWENAEYERENFTSVEFKKNSFEVDFYFTSEDQNYRIDAQLKSNKIEVAINKF